MGPSPMRARHPSQFAFNHIARPFSCSCHQKTHNVKLDDKITVLALAILAGVAGLSAGGFFLGAGSALLAFYLLAALFKNRTVSYVTYNKVSPPRMFIFRPGFYRSYVSRVPQHGGGHRHPATTRRNATRGSDDQVAFSHGNSSSLPSFNNRTRGPVVRGVPGTNTAVSSFPSMTAAPLSASVGGQGEITGGRTPSSVLSASLLATPVVQPRFVPLTPSSSFSRGNGGRERSDWGNSSNAAICPPSRIGGVSARGVTPSVRPPVPGGR